MTTTGDHQRKDLPGRGSEQATAQDQASDPERWLQAPRERFLQHCARGELAFQVGADGRAWFPPRLCEPGSGAPLRWRISGGVGVVHASTVLHPRGEEPRNLAVIELQEGFRMVSQVQGIPPQQVVIGMPVRCVFVEDLPVFEPIT